MDLDVLSDNKEVKRVLHRLFGSAKRRADKLRLKRPTLRFDLKLHHIESLWGAQHGRCAVSGLSFSMAPFDFALVKRPYGPSLDRIDAQKGYVRGNVRLVCTAVNFGLGQWGDEVFLPIAEATARLQASFLKSGGRRLSQRIEAALSILPLLSKADAKRQIRRIAALKRARTMGQIALTQSSKRARQSRRAHKASNDRGEVRQKSLHSWGVS